MKQAIAMVCALAAAMTAQSAGSEPRMQAAIDSWLSVSQNAATFAEFKMSLSSVDPNDVLDPTLLLRTASDWKRCKAVEFEVPPKASWSNLHQTLRLLKELRFRSLLPAGEPVSVYRHRTLNKCAGGADNSAHLRASAIDFSTSPQFTKEQLEGLCRFWRSDGHKWNMGLSQYSSGRIHIDTAGHRTWPGKSPVCAKHQQLRGAR